METQTIGDGKVVTIHYTLTLDSGEVADSSAGRDPLAYLHGAQNIIPGLESQLAGKAPGDKLDVKGQPEDGYGPRNDEAVQKVPRSAFPADVDLQEGLSFQAQDPSGHPLMGTIAALEGDEVTVDFNHPLAGKTLNFAVEVIGVREPTAEEVQHGHVHGPGGHQH